MNRKNCSSVSLRLMHNYVKTIPSDRDTVEVKIYGIRRQCAFSEGEYVEFSIASQLSLELDEKEDNMDYQNTDRPDETLRYTFFQLVKQSLLESITFNFEDGSEEEVRIPLASQKIYLDVFNGLHLMLTDVPVSYPFADHFKI